MIWSSNIFRDILVDLHNEEFDKILNLHKEEFAKIINLMAYYTNLCPY